MAGLFGSRAEAAAATVFTCLDPRFSDSEMSPAFNYAGTCEADGLMVDEPGLPVREAGRACWS